MNWLNDNVNVLTLIGAAAILILTIGVAGKYIKQMKTDKSGGELTGDNWDGVGEYKNPLPIGWSLSFIGTMIWALWYFFMGYPLGTFSQIGQYNEEVTQYNQKFESKWANPDHATLMGMGEGVFLVQCAPCHGITGDGMNGKAADLTKFGTEQFIVNVVLHGSKGQGYPLGEMPAGMLDESSAKAVAAYITQDISKTGTKHPELVETGKALFATCAACHGADGKGMGGSAPDLANFNKAGFVVSILNHGKKGVIGEMPAFNDGRLTKVQKIAVGTYVDSLHE
ncbi:cbb3-type cytochrome c oxidase N-terminal domain-containing protein [Sulfurospirillum sp. 1612]|uniref:cbb3-type cytochrome c oxidase N-terminal domain-containing protein n=1 Tax=Sulfurospirillum sp. 1612 TaxID=3094835 RepID=UPI002F949BF3